MASKGKDKANEREKDMFRLLVFITLIFNSLSVFSQEKPAKPNMEALKSEMVLRSNTRDKVYSIKSHQKLPAVKKRKQATIQRQQRIMQQRMQRIQRTKIQRHRMIQQRKLRQQAMRRRQMNQRK